MYKTQYHYFYQIALKNFIFKMDYKKEIKLWIGLIKSIIKDLNYGFIKYLFKIFLKLIVQWDSLNLEHFLIIFSNK
jgi:hypothetical protein